MADPTPSDAAGTGRTPAPNGSLAQQPGRRRIVLIIGGLAATLMTITLCVVVVAAATGVGLSRLTQQTGTSTPTAGDDWPRYSTSTFSLAAPHAWEASIAENALGLIQNGGVMFVVSDTEDPSISAEVMLSRRLEHLGARHPDVEVCGEAEPRQYAGVSGSTITLCYTITPENDPAYDMIEEFWSAINADGSIRYQIHISARRDSFTAFRHEAEAVAQSVRWSLR